VQQREVIGAAILKRQRLNIRLRKPGALKLLSSLDFRHKKRRPWTSFFVEVVGRGNLNLYSMSLIIKINLFFLF
jgi:hypothetical protein